MTLPARAAAVRGDDYQYTIGWYWACQALVDPDIESVSIEDSGGGHFDDVVVRRRIGASTYSQIKSSNHAKTVISEEWLATPVTAAGRSPMQHLHSTWTMLRGNGGPQPEIALVTNRGLDHQDPMLALRDNLTETVVDQLWAKGRRSEAGKARRRWADHLGISEDALYEFLTALRLQTEGSETSWNRQAGDAMRAAGLRSDDDALARGKTLVRTWVKTGAGPQAVDVIRRQVADAGLLARFGTLILAVHAIDRIPGSVRPTIELDWVTQFDGDTPATRRLLKNPAGWQQLLGPELAVAVRTLEAFDVRRVHICGAMRLPIWFAIGAAMPDVRGWVLSCDQRTVEWRTNVSPADVTPRVLARQALDQGPDLALAVGLTHDPTSDVSTYLTTTSAPVQELLTLGPAGEPSPTSIPDASYALGWARAARNRVYEVTRALRPPRIHLFLAGPAGAVLMLGHQWNLMPPTVVYEHTGHDYAPSLTVT
jgi:hypothetical protein